MRISDWSSDVCSSDLPLCFNVRAIPQLRLMNYRHLPAWRGPAFTMPSVISFPFTESLWLSPCPKSMPLHGRNCGILLTFKPNLERFSKICWRFIALPMEPDRSEEHLSEIQSLIHNSYAVFCLKKKKKTPENITNINYDDMRD